MSNPFSVVFQLTGRGEQFWPILLIIPASSSSRSLRLKTLGLSAGFDRNSSLKRSMFLSPTSVRIMIAHLCPRIPRSALRGMADGSGCARRAVFSFLGCKFFQTALSKPYLGIGNDDLSCSRCHLQTTVTNNLRLVERAWVDSINERSLEKFLDLHGEVVVLYDPTLGSLRGRPALEKMWKGLFSMFPDYQVRKVRSFGQEDWVCLEVEESGTMKGPIRAGPREVPATGKSFKIPSSIIARVQDGRIGEVRIYFDVLGLMAQLGLGP